MARLSLALAIAIVLGMAGVARASHEAHAPAHVFFTGDDPSFAGPNCLSLHVDEAGAPIKSVHIHGCGDCVFAISVAWTSAPPMIVLFRLAAPKRLVFHPRAPLHFVANVERFFVQSPRPPPAFS